MQALIAIALCLVLAACGRDAEVADQVNPQAHECQNLQPHEVCL